MCFFRSTAVCMLSSCQCATTQQQLSSSSWSPRLLTRGTSTPSPALVTGVIVSFTRLDKDYIYIWGSSSVLSLHRNLQRPIPTPNVPHGCAQSRDVMYEVSVDPCCQALPGPATKEIRRTVNLPKECSRSQCSSLFTTHHKGSCELYAPLLFHRECFHHILSRHRQWNNPFC